MAEALWFLAPVVGLGMDAMTHVVLLRSGVAGVLKGLFIAFFLGLGAVLLTGLALWLGADAGGPARLAAASIAYAALGYCYFHFVNLGVTARRFRILAELAAAHDDVTGAMTGGLAMDDILARYSSAEMRTRRLARLVDSGQVVVKDGRYVLAPSLMRTIVLCFLAARRLVFGRRGPGGR